MATSYAIRKSQHVCPTCMALLDTDTSDGQVYCAACKQDMLRYYYDQQSARWAATGPNLLAHCGGWHQIPAVPFTAPCCGIIYFEENALYAWTDN